MGDALILLSLLGAWAAEDINIVLVDPTTNGTSRAQVVLEGSMAKAASAASSFRGAAGSGSVRITGAKKLTGPTHTLLIFDQSGSFKKYWSRAFDAANGFADALPPNHTVEVATFGTGYQVHGKATNTAELKALLKKARAGGSGDKTTRMHALVKEGIQQIAKALPPSGDGLRQVVVFSDLDEEGTFTPQMAIEAANAQGVRVNLVYFATESARHTDNAQRLAEATGGRLVNATEGKSPAAELTQLATAGQRTWWLNLAYCDVDPTKASFTDSLKIEVWSEASSRLGSSLGFGFRHAADAVSSKACVARVVPAPVKTVPTTPPSFPMWLLGLACCLPLGLLALLAIPFLVARRDRSTPEPEAPAPAPVVESDHAEGTVAPEVFKPVAAGLLDRLPPTRLVRIRGASSTPATLEITRREQTIGAGAHNDIVVDGDTVSGEHASLELFPGGDLWVRDHDATNGTWVDGERLSAGERRLLRPGTELGFGQRLVYRVVQDSGTQPKDSPAPPAPVPAPAPAPASRKTTFRPVKAPKKGS